MGAISETLRVELAQPEFSEGYAESFLDAYIATQIKVLREQNSWNQTQLANEMDTTQTAISRIENVNYSAWNIRTLKKAARAFRLRLRVSFETYGSLLDDMDKFSREDLQRTPREKDPELKDAVPRDDAATQQEVLTGDAVETDALGKVAGDLTPEVGSSVHSTANEALQVAAEQQLGILLSGMTLRKLADFGHEQEAPQGIMAAQAGGSQTVILIDGIRAEQAQPKKMFPMGIIANQIGNAA